MNPDVDPATTDVSKHDKERKLKEQLTKELSATQTKELKHDVLKFIDDWRLTVIQRVGSIVNSKEEASKHLDQAEAPRGTEHAPPDTKVNPESSDPPGRPKHAADEMLRRHFPPVDTPLANLPESKKDTHTALYSSSVTFPRALHSSLTCSTSLYDIILPSLS